MFTCYPGELRILARYPHELKILAFYPIELRKFALCLPRREEARVKARREYQPAS
jgi:hypothetical protein